MHYPFLSACFHPSSQDDKAGTSLLRLAFGSHLATEEGFAGYDYSLTLRLAATRIVYLNRFVSEVRPAPCVPLWL